jgi:hypothetical protein
MSILPLNPLKEPCLLYVNKQSWPLSLLTNTVPDTPRLVIYGWNKVESVEI